MKIYIVSLATGVLVGLIYALLQVRSPAPPAIALIGLLGMLIGEQAVPIARKMLNKEPVTAAWLRTECAARITGVPPAAAPGSAPACDQGDGAGPADRGA
jgi:XapX domain-containing protein